MEVKDIVKIEWSNAPVLTTNQLAECLGCEPKNIANNFNRAKEYFEEGVDYFKLTGEALRQFKKVYPLLANKFSSHFFLWTATGAFLHGKLMRTVKAFALFEGLGDNLAAPTLQDIIIGAENIPVEEASVYAFDMSNDTVKIGVSSCVERRVAGVEYASELKVLRIYQTKDLPRALAFHLEKDCHKALAAYRVNGEFFSVPFEQACDELNKLFDKIAFEPTEKLELAIVYALLMSNLVVKIGYTSNPTERVKKIRAETKLEVIDFYSTRLMTLEEARTFEVSLKEKYAAECIGGEYFDVRFSDVCAEL